MKHIWKFATERTFHLHAAYVIVALSIFNIIDLNKASYFKPISGPLFGDWSTYGYLLNLWLVATLLVRILSIFLTEGVMSKLGVYLLLPIHALLISFGYCWLLLRLYSHAFEFYPMFMEITPLLGVSVILLLSRFKWEQIAIFNIAMAFAIMPIAFQYALIASSCGK